MHVANRKSNRSLELFISPSEIGDIEEEQYLMIIFSVERYMGKIQRLQFFF